MDAVPVTAYTCEASGYGGLGGVDLKRKDRDECRYELPMSPTSIASQNSTLTCSVKTELQEGIAQQYELLSQSGSYYDTTYSGSLLEVYGATIPGMSYAYGIVEFKNAWSGHVMEFGREYVTATKKSSDINQPNLDRLTSSIISPWVYVRGLMPGKPLQFTLTHSCDFSVAGIGVGLRTTRRTEHRIIKAVTLELSAPSTLAFGELKLGEQRVLPLPIEVKTDGPVTYSLSMRAGKVGATPTDGDLGGGAYTVNLPAEIQDKPIDLTGKGRTNLATAEAGIVTLDATITLRVPAHAALGEHTSNLTISVRHL